MDKAMEKTFVEAADALAGEIVAEAKGGKVKARLARLSFPILVRLAVYGLNVLLTRSTAREKGEALSAKEAAEVMSKRLAALEKGEWTDRVAGVFAMARTILVNTLGVEIEAGAIKDDATLAAVCATLKSEKLPNGPNPAKVKAKAEKALAARKATDSDLA